MQKWLMFLLMSLLTFGLLAADAEAKRLGGGKSLGYQRDLTTRSAPPAATQRAQPAPAAAARPAARSGASRWLGPLAGLAAGGLLAALLFGDAFSGLQVLDFILFALLGVGIFFLFRMLRSSRARPQPMAYAGSSAAGATKPFQVPEIGAGLREPRAPTAPARPDWFDEASFLRGAKVHFVRLQAAWDARDLKDIREYTTPQLFAELSLQLQERGDQAQFTEVTGLEAKLIDLTTEDDRVIASVRFRGEIREDENAAPAAFSEVWHVQRSLSESGANWYVAGIQQQG